VLKLIVKLYEKTFTFNIQYKNTLTE